MKFNSTIVRAVAVLAIGAAVGVSAIASSSASEPVTRSASVVPTDIKGWQIADGTLFAADMNPDLVKWFTAGPYNNTVTGATVKDGSLGVADLSAEAKAALKGKDGTNGTNGTDALLSVSKSVNLSDRDDTATNGSVWAKDNLLRSFDITRQHAAEASKCGATAVKCWLYTGTLGDTGTFKTVSGAVTPNDPTKNISGTISGNVVGIAEVEFYATSNTPDPSLVDATIAGVTSTTNMVKLFFPAATDFGGLKLTDWRWTYTTISPDTCETHTQAMVGGNTGNITGVNACTK